MADNMFLADGPESAEAIAGQRSKSKGQSAEAIAGQSDKPAEAAVSADPTAEVEDAAKPAESSETSEGAEGAGTDAETEPSLRDKFRERVKSKYPDLDMEDEDAYYTQMGGLMDEYEGYEKSTGLLRDAMSRSADFAEMLHAAAEDGFDPVVWMVRKRGLDLDALRDDPEYAEKLAEARKEYLANEAKGKEFLEEMKGNMPGTIDAQVKALQDAGFGERAEEIVGKIFQLADDITHGKWDSSIGVLLAKGEGYDGAVEAAREEGHAEGLNTKVEDKVRKLRGQQEHVAGTQTPVEPEKPQEKPRHMFMA